MQTITVTRKIDKIKKKALFFIDDREIAYVKQNEALPNGYYRAGVNCFAPNTNELFTYNEGFDDSVECVSNFIRETFSHEFGIEVKFID